MKISQVHHVAIICSDYERSKHFYTQILGLPIVAESFRAERDSWKLDLELPGGMQVELFSFPNPPKRVSHPEACGLRHLAFAVENLNDEVADLESQEVSVEPIRIDPLTGKQFTFFADPDGLPIELYENELSDLFSAE
jgi:glyoxylase I family protein